MWYIIKTPGKFLGKTGFVFEYVSVQVHADFIEKFAKSGP